MFVALPVRGAGLVSSSSSSREVTTCATKPREWR